MIFLYSGLCRSILSFNWHNCEMCWHIGLVFNLLTGVESSRKWYGFLIDTNKRNPEINKKFEALIAYGIQAYMVTAYIVGDLEMRIHRRGFALCRPILYGH